MKNKAIIIIVIVGVLIAAIVATVVVINLNSSKIIDSPVVKAINDNSNLPVKYMSARDGANLNLSGYERLNNFMSVDYKNSSISFSYYGYPNDESDYYLGEVELLDNKFNILGVTIGDDMNSAISKISKYGFKLDNENRNNNFVATLTNGDYTIKLNADSRNYDGNESNPKITSIKLRANSEYLGNRVY